MKREKGMKQLIKVIMLNLLLIVLAVFAYSDGFLALRPGDPSILRAGFAILLAPAILAALIIGNYKLLRGSGRAADPALPGGEDVETALKSACSSKYIGELARTALNQYRRLSVCAARALDAVHLRFEPGSMSGDRYIAAVSAAVAAAGENLKSAAVRTHMFNDDEYRRLLRFKEDTIPDDIQEQQLALYRSNEQMVRKAIAANEALILKLDTLALELSDRASPAAEDDVLLGEISQLTEELKFYQ